MPFNVYLNVFIIIYGIYALMIRRGRSGGREKMIFYMILTMLPHTTQYTILLLYVYNIRIIIYDINEYFQQQEEGKMEEGSRESAFRERGYEEERKFLFYFISFHQKKVLPRLYSLHTVNMVTISHHNS